MSVYELLHGIQTKLKAPKERTNTFGEYKYRSLQDILEAVKPLLDYGSTIIMSDELKEVGNRVYVFSTVTLSFGGESVSCTSGAREELERKKMHPEQLTGCASSYARKYALMGLFAIDDTQDADTAEPKETSTKPAKLKPEPTPEEQLKAATDFTDFYMKKLLDVKDQRDLSNLNYSLYAGSKSTCESVVKRLKNNHINLHKKIEDKITEMTKQWLVK